MKHRNRCLMVALVGAPLAAALALVALGGLPGRDVLAQGNTIYVDVDATGDNDGTSWEDAHTTLQPALDEAADGDEIWVAAGTYTPTYLFSPGDPRSATFQLKNGVALYGGFDPTVGDTGWEDRDWVNNVTNLSGDIGTQIPLTTTATMSSTIRRSWPWTAAPSWTALRSPAATRTALLTRTSWAAECTTAAPRRR